DARRFQEAVEETGAPVTATEPVAALAQRFETELDLSLAAAEAAVSAENFLTALDTSASLAKHLGPLRVEGGTVQRQVFVVFFPELIEALKVGDFLAPRDAAYARLI